MCISNNSVPLIAVREPAEGGWSVNTHLGASLASARLNPVHTFVNTELTWMLSITKHDIS